MKVLIIEDECYIRENIIEILQFNGIEAHGAADGHTGLELIRSLQPCLVICDVLMDGLSGYDVLHALRADPALASTKLVFVTGLADHQAMKRALLAGARDYLIKPFTQDELLNLVNRYLAAS